MVAALIFVGAATIGMHGSGDADGVRPGSQAFGPWSTFRGNSQRTGLSPDLGPRRPRVLWTANLGVLSEPVFGRDGSVIVHERTSLTRLSPDGVELWRRRVGRREGGGGSPSIGPDGTIYVGVNGGLGPEFFSNYLAVRGDGSLKWRIGLGGAFPSSAPAVATNGESYLAHRNLRAFTQSGRQRWAVPGVGGTPTIGRDGSVIVGSYRRGAVGLISVNGDGEIGWLTPMRLMVGSAPVVAQDGTIYANSRARALFALNPDGTVKWRIRSRSDSSPALGPDGTIYVTTYLGELRAIAPDGREVWRRRIAPDASLLDGGDYDQAPSVDAAGTIYVAGKAVARRFRAPVQAFNPDGSLMWAWDSGVRPAGDTSSPVVAFGRLYVVDDQTGLWALGDEPSREVTTTDKSERRVGARAVGLPMSRVAVERRRREVRRPHATR